MRGEAVVHKQEGRMCMGVCVRASWGLFHENGAWMALVVTPSPEDIMHGVPCVAAAPRAVVPRPSPDVVVVLFVVYSPRGPLLTRVRFRIRAHLLGVLGLLACLAGGGAARQRAVGEEGSVDVARTVAAWSGAVYALELHGGGGGYGSFVLLHGAAALQHAHLVPVGDRAAGCAVAFKCH